MAQPTSPSAGSPPESPPETTPPTPAEVIAANAELGVDLAGFEAYLAERPGYGPTHLPELLLTYACAHSNPAAQRRLERDHFAAVATLLPPRYSSDAAEVAQLLRHRLLMPDTDGRVRIGDYAGRGSLRGWLRVAAVRTALNLRRSQKRETPFEEDRELADRAVFDLELAQLKGRYRLEFKEAFSAALASLELRDRNLLRQHYLDGLTMETIGPLYRVHRITIVRWMNKARMELAAATRRELSRRLRVERTELESIMRLIESQLDMSLRAFLVDP